MHCRPNFSWHGLTFCNYSNKTYPPHSHTHTQITKLYTAASAVIHKSIFLLILHMHICASYPSDPNTLVFIQGYICTSGTHCKQKNASDGAYSQIHKCTSCTDAKIDYFVRWLQHSANKGINPFSISILLENKKQHQWKLFMHKCLHWWWMKDDEVMAGQGTNSNWHQMKMATINPGV